jgi:hypothetical protein
MDKTRLDEFVSRYIAMWHEPDDQRRHDIVRGLWADDAENFTARFSVRGVAEIIARVDRSHREWVASKGFVFRAAGNTASHNHLVKFLWEMLPRGGGPLEARGLDIFVLDAHGLIRSLYQFGEPLPAVVPA